MLILLTLLTPLILLTLLILLTSLCRVQEGFQCV
jgi:hypothetical protein